ncbi:MAG: LCP family protein [Selenomonas massiliensis]
MEQKRSYRRIGILVAVLLVAAAAAAAAHFFGGGLARRTTADGMIAGSSEIHVMILGVDERKDDVGRSDTLMVATVDPEKGTASLLSIPRDTRVAIEGVGYDKINAAYAYGGYALTKKTLEQLLDVPMDYYILIDVHAFERIIDALDGIDIDVEKRMYYEDPWDDDGGLIIDLRPGMQHMDGKTAVTYVRYRDEEGDIGRVKRQQKFMRACVDAVTTPAILPRLPGIITSVIDSVKTDLSVRQMLEFIGTLKESHTKGLRTDMVPGRPLYIDEVSYWIPDMAQLRRGMANALGITLSSTERSRMERDVRAYEESIPAGATEVPAGENGIGRAVSADEALDTAHRKGGKDTKDEKDGRKKSSSDQPRSTRESGEEKDTRPGRSSETVPASDTGGRHASTRQSGSAAEPSAQRTERSESSAAGSDAPTRGSAGTGKEE